MSKRRPPHRTRPRTRVRADGSVASASRARSGDASPDTKGKADATGKAGVSASASSARTGQPPVPAGSRPDFRAILAGASFRRSLWPLGAGAFALLLSQGIPHEYGFLELGGLFTLSVYDLVLAMLGLSLGAAVAETRRDLVAIVCTFFGVLVVMLTFFDAIFGVILASPLGEVLYLIAPAAVMLTGASLWLSGRFRQWAVLLAAAVVAFSFSLFVGLDDLGVGLLDFAAGTVASALWLILAPALVLRQFRGPWLTIPSRIVGSWLIVIGIIVLASLYVPMPLKGTTLPDPSQPDGGAIELQIPEDGSAPMLNGETLDLDGGTGQLAPEDPQAPVIPDKP